MLDKSLIGEKEPLPPLKCEKCGLLFGENTDQNDNSEARKPLDLQPIN